MLFMLSWTRGWSGKYDFSLDLHGKSLRVQFGQSQILGSMPWRNSARRRIPGPGPSFKSTDFPIAGKMSTLPVNWKWLYPVRTILICRDSPYYIVFDWPLGGGNQLLRVVFSNDEYSPRWKELMDSVRFTHLTSSKRSRLKLDKKRLSHRRVISRWQTVRIINTITWSGALVADHPTIWEAWELGWNQSEVRHARDKRYWDREIIIIPYRQTETRLARLLGYQF